MADVQERWCVVTGGRGFAARHLVEMLIRYEMFHVRIADLGPAIKLEPDEEEGTVGKAMRSGRAKYVSMDLRDKSQVLKACEGAEVVFHMAAPDSSVNNHQLHHSVNVLGTKNIIDACVELKVKRLIYTSSPSVVFDGVHGIINGDESLPYPSKHNDSYSATKAEGEALVIKSNDTKGLLTCCIRPSSIFGPGDRLLVPSLVAAARAGKSKFIIGDGNNMYDFTYVENVAHAHVCAERALASGGAVADKASGQAYFVTNMEPMKFWEFVALILEGFGYERPRIKIPASVMMPIAHLVEFTYKLLAAYGMKVPQLTPSRIRLLSRSRTFSCSKANDRLGYTPIVPLQDGLRRTIESYPHLRAEQRPKKEGPSKASLFLGSGRGSVSVALMIAVLAIFRHPFILNWLPSTLAIHIFLKAHPYMLGSLFVADTLLWRNKKQTLTAALVLAAIYFNFIASGFTMITSVSTILLVASIFLFIHGRLPQRIMGYKIDKVPVSCFHVSEETSHQFALSVVSGWNSAVKGLKSLCKGADCMFFLKVALSLLILSILGTISLRSLFAIGIPGAFTLFFIYEKKEEEIDHLLQEIVSFTWKLKSDISGRIFSSAKD
ncbi:3beta-hydroxysteroid-dehydrogenase/decarboxylase-like isoform X1 [Solanum dulcamara]|uniref:3beta-hydroxysteroid- dehydrogenase/decarboxylase-like isoform X1 n=1 Tax=Solanum dulcamara TaxID=45834 RepID=UPI0024857171|nr:3beta-hydroxysteroid-dehydrogenase/decarboxylase-like isoform X1 [Solanum dulcamara]XP_055803174.1 3beta-hydroxysteroid-dehydrogenase/decarboxylase-like isoform X1 [Solanum dulcamara]